MVEFNHEGQNEGNNGGTMMYNYGLDHREICGQFLVLTDGPLMCEGRSSSYTDIYHRIKGEMVTTVEKLEGTV